MTNSPERVAPVACVFDVRRNAAVCREHLLLTLSLTGLPKAVPGQFVYIGPHEEPSAGDPAAPFLRRAFSIGGLRRTGAACELDILYRVVGAGSRWLATLRPGDRLAGIGPLGNGFPAPPTEVVPLLVAGGVGLPPLLWFAQELSATQRTATLLLGAQTGALIPDFLCDDQRSGRGAALPGIDVVLATDDGSTGFAGDVVEALADHTARTRTGSERLAVYTCGPEAMLRAVAKFCAERSITCHACLERSMACGMGTCQSCVVPVEDATDPDGWRYALCCTEGPVFDASAVIWAS
jgi:dihydroorotate dehydrogenase electron transfer subunit